MSTIAPLWTRNFIVASMITSFQAIVFYMLLVVIAGYAVHELDASTTQAGIISGLFIVGMLSGRLTVNQLIDRFERKTVLWTSTILFTLCSGLYVFSSSIESLSFIRFLHGLSFGIANSLVSTIVAQIIPPSRRAEGIGYYSLSITMGTALGPFLGIFLILNASYDAIFIASVAAAMLACLVTLGLNIPALPEKKAPSLEHAKPSFFQRVIEPAVFPIGAVMVICSVCYSGVLSFITFYTAELDITKAATVFFLVYAVATLLSRPVTGKLMDKHGENIVMYPALIALGIGFIVLAFTQNSFHLLTSAALFGFGFGNLQSIGQEIAIKSAPIERMGVATSTFFITVDAGFGFGPFILGAVVMYLNYSELYLFSAFVVAFSILLYFLVHGRKAKIIKN